MRFVRRCRLSLLKTASSEIANTCGLANNDSDAGLSFSAFWDSLERMRRSMSRLASRSLEVPDRYKEGHYRAAVAKVRGYLSRTRQR